MLRSSSVSSPLASFEIHLLTVLARQVAHQTRHFLKQYSYRNHAHGHGRFLDPFCNAFELRKIAQQPWSADLLYFRIVPDHGLGDDHLAHHIQQVVEFSDVNFYRPRIAGSRPLLALGFRCGFHSDLLLRRLMAGYSLRQISSRLAHARACGYPSGRCRRYGTFQSLLHQASSRDKQRLVVNGVSPFSAAKRAFHAANFAAQIVDARQQHINVRRREDHLPPCRRGPDRAGFPLRGQLPEWHRTRGTWPAFDGVKNPRKIE